MSDAMEWLFALLVGPLATAGWIVVWRFISKRRILSNEPLTKEEARTRWEVVVTLLSFASFFLFLVGLTSAVTIVLVLGGMGLPMYGTPFWTAIGLYYAGIAILWALVPYSHVAAPLIIRRGIAMARPKVPPVPLGAFGVDKTPMEAGQAPMQPESPPSPAGEQR